MNNHFHCLSVQSVFLFLFGLLHKNRKKSQQIFYFFNTSNRIQDSEGNIYLVKLSYCDGYPYSSERASVLAWINSGQLSFKYHLSTKWSNETVKNPSWRDLFSWKRNVCLYQRFPNVMLWDRYFLVIAAVTPHSLPVSFIHRKMYICFRNSHVGCWVAVSPCTHLPCSVLVKWAQHHTTSNSCSSSELASCWLGHGSSWASVSCGLLCRYSQDYCPLQGNGDHLCFFWSEAAYLSNNNTLYIYCS